MRKLIMSVLVILLVLSITATASMIIPVNDKAKENAKAPEKSPAIGKNWDLERVDFIHYAKPNNPAKPPKTETCYKLLGVKWKTLPVSYVINPSNQYGLSEEFVTGAISTAAEEWDAATISELFNDISGIDYYAQYGILDSKNAIAFGDYPQAGVIAVTSIWYTRRGKEIVEFDMLFDTDFAWGDAEKNPTVMDLQNIATHELGHGVGLADLYTSACTAVTMYGYSDYGETSKRDLEPADITGLQSMYGI